MFAQQEHESKGLKNAKEGFIDFTGGTLGGIAIVLFGQPLDTVKVKMQTFPGKYNNMLSCFAQTFKSDGLIKGLYAGTVPALAANIAENSVLFLGYGVCQKFMQNVTGARGVEELTALSNATAGFLAAFFSSLVLCPTELIKCQLQAMQEVQKKQGAAAMAAKRVSILGLIAEIVKRDGPAGMFKGLVPTIAREMPGYFVFFGGYEATRGLLTNPGQSKDAIGPAKTMVAGGVGGVLFWLLTFPADVVKSRMQVGKNGSLGMVGMIMKISKTEGVGRLYNGLTPTLVRTIPATGILFLVYEYSRKLLLAIL